MITRLLSILLLHFTVALAMGQGQLRLDTVAVLEGDLPEVSGLAWIDGQLWGHNDSGDAPRFYQIDTSSGMIQRTVHLRNVNHIDWEDITYDATHLYLADFGNNRGNRTDLQIYRLARTALDTTLSDTLDAEIIYFNYEDQVDFSNQQFQTNFDAEALLVRGDSLYIFTKNWGDFRTNIYRLPKQAGTYTAERVDSLTVSGLITGVDQNASGDILLIGYGLTEAFIIELKDLTGQAFSQAQLRRRTVPFAGSNKIEGVAHIESSKWWLATERNNNGEPVLYKLDTDFTTTINGVTADERVCQLVDYGNQFSYRNCPEGMVFSVYAADGQMVYNGDIYDFYLSRLPSGMYLMEGRGRDGRLLVWKKILKP